MTLGLTGLDQTAGSLVYRSLLAAVNSRRLFRACGSSAAPEIDHNRPLGEDSLRKARNFPIDYHTINCAVKCTATGFFAVLTYHWCAH